MNDELVIMVKLDYSTASLFSNFNFYTKKPLKYHLEPLQALQSLQM